ncbi:hypothetical protein K0T92_14535 [Paenibacillus oenotherae]|uniref:Uncharacterized protein n=1 Tax=Paenibacillus oenotherae TaxID=1435645 RepID=A0ABS7D7V4_9BACL|nr:hypothetical protein [Paenibacillus oenotherae]MBW7475960.1 hypothetical protein [Paenibacillus oenotherae]
MPNRYATLVGSNRISDEYTKINTGFDTVQAEMDTHTADNGAHGATSAATVSRIIRRDAAGRAKVVAPAAADDIARKDTVDAAITTAADDATTKANAVQANLDTHTGNASIHTSAAEKSKLAGIEAGAEVNQPAFSTINDIVADDPEDTLTIVGGTGITVSTNPATKTAMITATGTATPGAHASSHVTGGADVIPDAVAGGNSGLMSGADKTAVDNATAHIAATTGVHGATSAATASRIPIRDASGRFKVAAPSAADDVARKDTVDNAVNMGMERQAIINGNFDIWQRGSTFTNPSNGGYTADRYVVAYVLDGGTNPTLTHSRLTLASGDIAGGYYGYRINTSGAGSGFGANSMQWLAQKIEFGTRYMCGVGKKVTVSFWAKSNIANKKIGVWARQNYGSGGSPSASEVINGANWTLTSSWTRYSYTFATNTLAGKTFGSDGNDNLEIAFSYQWGATLGARVGSGVLETLVGAGDIDIKQIQFNAGESVLPFQPRTFAEESIMCRRYCFALSSDAANTTYPVGFGYGASSTVAYIGVVFPVEMRMPPTLVATASDWQLQDGNSATDVTSLAILNNRNSKNSAVLQVTVTSLITAHRPYSLNADGIAGRMIIFDAEL